MTLLLWVSWECHSLALFLYRVCYLKETKKGNSKTQLGNVSSLNPFSCINFCFGQVEYNIWEHNLESQNEVGFCIMRQFSVVLNYFALNFCYLQVGDWFIKFSLYCCFQWGCEWWLGMESWSREEEMGRQKLFNIYSGSGCTSLFG